MAKGAKSQIDRLSVCTVNGNNYINKEESVAEKWRRQIARTATGQNRYDKRRYTRKIR